MTYSNISTSLEEFSQPSHRDQYEDVNEDVFRVLTWGREEGGFGYEFGCGDGNLEGDGVWFTFEYGDDYGDGEGLGFIEGFENENIIPEQNSISIPFFSITDDVNIGPSSNTEVWGSPSPWAWWKKDSCT
jgi:hypothetical protein